MPNTQSGGAYQYADGRESQATALVTMAAAPLKKGGVPLRETVTCTNAGQNYIATNNIPAATGYLVLNASADCLVAIDEATSATVGERVPAGVTTYRVTFTGSVKVNVQSATAGATLEIGYKIDD